MELLRREIQDAQEARQDLSSQLAAERRARATDQALHAEAISGLERQLAGAREKRKQAANERAAKNAELAEGFRVEMTNAQKQIAKLEDANKGLQLRLAMAAESRGSAGVSVGKGAPKVGDDGSLHQSVAELQNTVKKKEQELVTLKEKVHKATEDKKAQNAKVAEL